MPKRIDWQKWNKDLEQDTIMSNPYADGYYDGVMFARRQTMWAFFLGGIAGIVGGTALTLIYYGVC